MEAGGSQNTYKVISNSNHSHELLPIPKGPNPGPRPSDRVTPKAAMSNERERAHDVVEVTKKPRFADKPAQIRTIPQEAQGGPNPVSTGVGESPIEGGRQWKKLSRRTLPENPKEEIPCNESYYGGWVCYRSFEWLQSSPANHSESPMLELLRVGELLGSLGDSLVGESKKPRFLFLIETKVKSDKLQWLRCSLGFKGMFQVDPVGHSGGLVFFWKFEKEVKIVNYSQKHVTALITMVGGNFPWTFTGFYGHPDRALHKSSRKLLSRLSSLCSSAWLCMGDFNEIVSHHEKVGCAIKNEAHMRFFLLTLEDCNLSDLGYRGSKYTWSNKRDLTVFVKERLDRSVASPDWYANFPNFVVDVLPVSTLDHRLLWLQFDSRSRIPPKLFRFEAKWNLDEECLVVVNEAWNREGAVSNPLGSMWNNLVNCKTRLKEWSKSKFADADRQIATLSKRLDRLQNAEHLGNLATIKQLFTTKGVEGITDCTDAVLGRVSPKLNEKLFAEFVIEEINQALAQIHPLKSPGPDGFGVSFYQHHWGIIRDHVRAATLHSLNGGTFDSAINETFIARIPKSPTASSISEYQHISLCNVLYKLIAKVLANRLKLVLPSIISHNQSAFVPGRLITDNVLVAYEALHSMNTRMRSKKGFMAVELDMRKAYDHVE
ncbi:uncharacterized protein LOC133873303 [Alnus glutinosa]|uniref:uncharacterized protein LOC133873303 n=1 Tax=Alnus glutinosa TaxID=3517 RepID=UPI002D765B7F|nr:uncharacterized protein LOC133873303 [Alnus glutinosa]